MNNKILQVVALVLVIGGFVVLTLKDKDVSSFIGLVTPVLAALFVVGHLNEQDKTLGQIQEQTNGVLTRKIKDAVAAALAEMQGKDDTL